MCGDGPAGLAPVEFAGGVLDPFRHVCAFVNGREEGNRILDPFVLDGVALGDTLMYFVDPAERASQVSHLRHLGLDTPNLLQRGQFIIHTWQETYLSKGHFDQESTIEIIDALLGDSSGSRIRLITDMSWASAAPDVGRLVLEYEAQAGAALPKYPHISICVYDITKFSADVLIDVLRTHPMALIGGMLQVNPFYVPAAEFLAELHSRNPSASHA